MALPAIFIMRRILIVCWFHVDIMILRVYGVSFFLQTAYLIYWV